MNDITLFDLQKSLPPALKKHATEELVDQLNSLIDDPIEAEEYKKNFIGFISVLQQGNFRISDYISAVRYTSYRLRGMSVTEAYQRTFPDRYMQLKARGVSDKEVQTYASAYNRNILVNKIMEQAMIPVWILNQELFQEALNTQFALMRDPAVSPMVRSTAANSLLTHLSRPKEVANTAITIDMRESSGLVELKEAIAKLAGEQQKAIQAGTDTKLIAGSSIIDVEAK